MKATIAGVTFHEMKTVPSKDKKTVYRFAEIRDVDSFTKMELFVADDFDSPIPALGTKVNAVVKIAERRNTNGVSLTLLSLRP